MTINIDYILRKTMRWKVLELSAAWKAIIEKGKVVCWQVFADTKVQFDAMK